MTAGQGARATPVDSPPTAGAADAGGAERRARLLLNLVVEPGDPDAARLVREFSAVDLVERLRHGGLRQSKAVAWADRLDHADANAERTLAAAAEAQARFLIPCDPEWPPTLGDLRAFESGPSERRAGEPVGLWVRGTGTLNGLCATAVSVVGARAASEYGIHVAGDLAAGCAASGVTVVSGAAYGIDAAAHRGALAVDGPTIAVLAAGVDLPTPSGLTERIAAHQGGGLLVSEAPPGRSPTRSRFLIRNRLIAVLSQGSVVVEAALRSGSLSTARWAREMNRIVMGVPGPITSMMSAGVHQLLRQPETVLVTTTDEVLELVSPLSQPPALLG